mmetsp:Transcript_38280/g.56383  ORF Transcript_38280/g.56383 Transcript_38280/m.56383 type:complete len:338 (-) Transcript_38280:84-1097(-)
MRLLLTAKQLLLVVGSSSTTAFVLPGFTSRTLSNQRLNRNTNVASSSSSSSRLSINAFMANIDDDAFGELEDLVNDDGYDEDQEEPLSEERIQLREIMLSDDTSLIPTEESAKFEFFVSILDEFYKTAKHADVPTEPLDLIGTSHLIDWMDGQRRELFACANGRESSMTDERKERLEKIGFDFCQYEHFVPSVCRLGNSKAVRPRPNVESTAEEEEVVVVERLPKRKESALPERGIAVSAPPPNTQSTPKAVTPTPPPPPPAAATTTPKKKQKDVWFVRYEELIEYKSKHGDVNVSEDDAEYPELASWVTKERRRVNSMAKKKKELLMELNFWEESS